MVYNRYYLGTWLRVIFLIITIFLFCWIVLNTQRFYTNLFLALVIISQVWELVQYQNKTNLYLARFLINLREQNLSFRLDSKHPGNSFTDLTNILTEIQSTVVKANLEKEKQYHYLNYVISNLDVGVITFYPSGKIELCNLAALKILDFKSLTSIGDLDRVQEGMGAFVLSLTGGQHCLYKMNRGSSVSNLSFRCGEFRIGAVEMKLVSFQDIHNELEEQELDSWQKLISVLTHEIMNSITPLNTLAQSLIRQIRQGDGTTNIDSLNNESLEDLIIGLEMIEERGTGVLEFVNKFRSLTRMPLPQFHLLDIDMVMEKLMRLFRQEMTMKGINLVYMPKENPVTILADEKLLIQSLINLIKNAVEAIADKSAGEITISTDVNSDNRNVISITDNGFGIAPEDMDKVFVPFFTTKETGSGIGLSFARQVMRLHKGHINIEPAVPEGTTINLIF